MESAADPPLVNGPLSSLVYLPPGWPAPTPPVPAPSGPDQPERHAFLVSGHGRRKFKSSPVRGIERATVGGVCYGSPIHGAESAAISSINRGGRVPRSSSTPNQQPDVPILLFCTGLHGSNPPLPQSSSRVVYAGAIRHRSSFAASGSGSGRPAAKWTVDRGRVSSMTE